MILPPETYVLPCTLQMFCFPGTTSYRALFDLLNVPFVEEEAGTMYAHARYKYPAAEQGAWQKEPCPLDLSDVPMNLPPIPSDRAGSASRFKGVRKGKKKWAAQIRIPSEGRQVYLGMFDSEEEAGIMHARARYKYPVEDRGYS